MPFNFILEQFVVGENPNNLTVLKCETLQQSNKLSC